MNKLADAYITPARSIVVHTTPGRVVNFYSGHAVVQDHRDMPHLLSRDDVRLIPTPQAVSWADEWLKNTRELKATVEWPEHVTVRHNSQDDYVVVHTVDVADAGPAVLDPADDDDDEDDEPPSPANDLINRLLRPAPEKPARKARARS